MTHVITEAAGLQFHAQSGALTESICDVMGILMKQWKLGQTDAQPAHMRAYVKTDDNNGGVHINCGIPNHAFYRLATALGGPAWERAGRIGMRL
jgi:Zn-dependent metalloprotease